MDGKVSGISPDRNRFGRMLLLSALCLILWAIPGISGADTKYQISFSCASSEIQTEVVARVTGDSNYTVFLPGSWDLRQIRVTFEQPRDIGFGERTVYSGDVVDLSGMAGSEMVLTRNGGASFGKITIYQGSSTAAVHVRVSASALRKVIRDKHVIIPEGWITVTDPGGTVNYDGPLTQFKGRGNATYSSQYPKKPFQFKLSRKADLCGMGKAKTWVLLANYLDISLLRNQINLDLAREIGMKGAVECVQADLWLNGEYNGLYLLTEKIQINKNRLNIRNLEEEVEELNDQPLDQYRHFKDTDKKTKREVRGYEIPNEPEDITGGYIIELDKYYRYHSYARSGFASGLKLYFVVKEPSQVSRAQVYYLSDLFEKLLRGMKAEDGYDPVSGAYYGDLIDMESFARKFLVEDFAKNYDALAGSQYFFKDRDSVDGKIYAGPCWDYDLCLGNINVAGIGSGLHPRKSWVINIKNGKTNWYAMLYKHADFQAEVRRVYREQVGPALAALIGEDSGEGRILRNLEQYREAIAASSAMNFIRFRAESVPGIYERSGRTNDAALQYLFQWIRERVADMDEEYGAEELNTFVLPQDSGTGSD